MKINLFRAMRKNIAENDERISRERTRIGLFLLRFIQFVFVFIQLFNLIFPTSEYFALPQYVFLLIILPFAVEPAIACARGFVGASKSDTVLFLIGMIEFGYFVFYLTSKFFPITPILPLVMFFVGMIIYYLLCIALYNASLSHMSRDSDDT